MNHSNGFHSIQSLNSNYLTGKNNPWDDNKNFIQDVGDLEGFLNFLENNGIDSLDTEISKAKTKEINCVIFNDDNSLKDNKSDENNLLHNLNLLIELNDISKENFEKLKVLELLYENYRNESILSKFKNDELCEKITYLSEILEKIENNRIKLANLIHNTHLTDNNIIKIKHEKKFEFIKIMKSLLSQLDNQNISQRNHIELIRLSSNIHPETLNKIVCN